MHPFVRAVAEFAAARALILPNSKVVVALSGGPDSCALLLALWDAASKGILPFPVAAAHFHHGLRGEDADGDAAFCAMLCAGLGIPCLIGFGHREMSNRSPNAAARDNRYGFLRKAAAQFDAGTIATAHTFDDQAETVLGRVLRGTSVDGLAGIPLRRKLDKRVEVIRPLLTMRRTAIEEFCAAHQIVPRRDPSNEKPRYTRSRLRALLPKLADDFNPRLTDALNRLSTHATLDASLLYRLANNLWNQNLEQSAPGLIRLRASLAEGDPALRSRVLLRALREVVRVEKDDAGEGDISGTVTEDLILEELATGSVVEKLDMLLAEGSGSVDLPGGVRAEADQKGLLLTTPVDWYPVSGYDVSLPVPGEVWIPQIAFRLRSSIQPSAPLTNRTRRSLRIDISCGTIPSDAAFLSRLRVRSVRLGDRIAPLGMRGTRSVLDVMADAGWYESLRFSAPLVVRGDTNEVLWIVGLVQSETTRVSPTSKSHVLHLSAEWDC